MFDPFGDYASRGYLRNHCAQTDTDKVKQLEHAAFRGHVGEAMAYLASRDHLEYRDVKHVHKILFSDVYPWAGEDRRENAPNINVTKAGLDDLFSHPRDIELATSHALQRGQDVAAMRDKPGEIMGYLAHAHPFLDGNGRTIMTVHADLCRRAGIHIDWSQTEKTAYLNALTRELQDPGKGHLDTYLKPFVREGVLERTFSAEALQAIRGLGPIPVRSPSTQILISAREIDTNVTKAEIEAAAAQSSSFGKVRSGLEMVANKVFADPSRFLEAAHSAAFGGRIGSNPVLDELANSPAQFGSFRGKDGRFSSREERQEHRTAVAMQYSLRSQVKEYVALIHFIRQQLSQDRHELARRNLQEVPAPSEGLNEALRSGQAFSDQQTAELRTIVRALEQRFGDDVGHLRGNAKLNPDVAARHGIDQATLQEARATIRKLDRGMAQAIERAPGRAELQTQGRGGPIR
jgi:fido (protein-threonine AMPylation protein)